MQLDIPSIADDKSCLLFMWTTGPQFASSIKLGESWGFEYKTVAFVWNKIIHNPGIYTLSQAEFCIVFKRGTIPTPRGARNVRQLVEYPRGEHSQKTTKVIEGISKMFPEQEKTELFARANYNSWDNWELEILDNKTDILTNEELELKEN